MGCDSRLVFFVYFRVGSQAAVDNRFYILICSFCRLDITQDVTMLCFLCVLRNLIHLASLTFAIVRVGMPPYSVRSIYIHIQVEWASFYVPYEVIFLYIVNLLPALFLPSTVSLMVMSLIYISGEIILSALAGSIPRSSSGMP